MRSFDPQVPARRVSGTQGRTGATRATRPDSHLLEPGDRRHVALHPSQPHHRGLPQQNGAHQSSSLRLPQLRKLQTARQGTMWVISLVSGDAPVVGVEPSFWLLRPLILLSPKSLNLLVGAGRFERPTPCAQGRCATRRLYARRFAASLILNHFLNFRYLRPAQIDPKELRPWQNRDKTPGVQLYYER